MKTPEIFDEIRPYETGEMKQAFEEMLNDRQFNRLTKGFLPWLPRLSSTVCYGWHSLA